MRLTAMCLLIAVIGCGSRTTDESTEGRRTGVSQADKNLATQHCLREIGRAYSFAVEHEKSWVAGPKNLDPNVQRFLRNPRDDKPFHIVWNFKRLNPLIPSDKRDRVLLAWEQTKDQNGRRFALLTDFTTVVDLSEEEFASAIQAEPNKK